MMLRDHGPIGDHQGTRQLRCQDRDQDLLI